MLWIERRVDGRDRGAFRDPHGGEAYGGAAQAVADQDPGSRVLGTHESGGGDQVGDVGGEAGVAEIPGRIAEPGEVEAQHRGAALGEALGDALGREHVLGAGEAMGEQAERARPLVRPVEPPREQVAARAAKLDLLGPHDPRSIGAAPFGDSATQRRRCTIPRRWCWSGGQEAAMSNDMKFEIVVIPVSDVDRSKAFYANLGWRLDADYDDGKGFRVVQFTPPGSGCSIIFGSTVSAAAPGSTQGLYLIVSDIVAARDELRGRGVEVSELFHSDGVYVGTDEPYLFGRRRTSGPDAARGSYRSFASFRDPDGNGWLFQEITKRQPGRIDSGVTSFASANDLAAAFRRAETAHGVYETRLGKGRDAIWSEWYAAYMVAEQAGTELPS